MENALQGSGGIQALFSGHPNADRQWVGFSNDRAYGVDQGVDGKMAGDRLRSGPSESQTEA
jgi:hypothetical protein